MTGTAITNLHRELAPVSAPAWAGIEDEARRALTLHLAARRVVDVREPAGIGLSAVGTGHLTSVEPPAAGVTARLREVRPVAELRASFRLDRAAIDDVERGARDADWHPVRDAARAIALAEDRVIIDGYPAARIAGIRMASPHPPLPLPASALGYPETLERAMDLLRAAGVGGPGVLLLGPAAYAAASQTADAGHPVRDLLAGLVGADVIWAPALDGGLLVSARGGDYELHPGQDFSIGYLSHDADGVDLYLQESLTFLVHSAEAAVPLTAPAA